MRSPFVLGDLFDDCPLCRAMLKADKEGRALSMQEYFDAATEANKMGGLSGFF